MASDPWLDLVLDERARQEMRADAVVRNSVHEQVSRALAALKATGSIAFDPKPMEVAVESIARDVYNESFHTALEHWGIRAKSLRDIVDALIEAYIRLMVVQRTSLINDTTRRMIAQAIMDGMGQGLDTVRVAELLEERWLAENPDDGPITAARSLRVVRTEVGSAQQAAHLSGAKEAGMTHKKWRSIVDDRTRQNPPRRYPYRGFDHAEPWDPATGQGTNGQIVKIENPFEVSGELLQHPGDSSAASPGNFVNCRCAVQYLFRRA